MIKENAETTLLREIALALLMLLRKEQRANKPSQFRYVEKEAYQEVKAALNALTKAYDEYIGAQNIAEMVTKTGERLRTDTWRCTTWTRI